MAGRGARGNAFLRVAKALLCQQKREREEEGEAEGERVKVIDRISSPFPRFRILKLLQLPYGGKRLNGAVLTRS